MKRAKGIVGFPPAARTVFLLLGLFGAILPRANAQNPGESWDIRENKDALTGESGFFARLDDRKSQAQVSVTCEPSKLTFEIRSALGFRLIQGSPSLIFGQVYTPQPVVSMRVSIDGHVDVLQAPVSSSSTNIVRFPFHGVQSSYDAIIRAPRSTPFARSEAQAEKVWAVDSILQARLIQFELPLKDGEAPIVRILSQDPTFRPFVDRCNRERSLVPSTPGYLRDDKRFAGTVDEFAAAFPGMLTAAAASAGLDARKYAKAAEIVVGTVRMCAQITPAMGQSVAGKGPRGLDAGDQLEGGKYAHCFSGNNTILLSTAGDSPAPAAERGITLLISPPQGFPGGWVKGPSFGVDVFFPPAGAANPYLLTGQGVETIMRARVDRAK